MSFDMRACSVFTEDRRVPTNQPLLLPHLLSPHPRTEVTLNEGTREGAPFFSFSLVSVR